MLLFFCLLSLFERYLVAFISSLSRRRFVTYDFLFFSYGRRQCVRSLAGVIGKPRASREDIKRDC